MSMQDLVPWHWGKKNVPVRRGKNGSPMAGDLFQSLWEDFPVSPFSLLKDEEAFVPKVNVKDTPEALLISVELPGLTDKDIDISLSDDMLTLSGEKKQEKEETDKDGYHYVERSYGSFRRVIPLRCAVNEDAVDATFRNGVLTITLPKSGDAKAGVKKIAPRCS